jgi:hypothetical protein
VALATRVSGVVIVKSSMPGTVPPDPRTRSIHMPYGLRSQMVLSDQTTKRRRRCFVCVQPALTGVVIPPHSMAATSFLQHARPTAP